MREQNFKSAQHNTEYSFWRRKYAEHLFSDENQIQRNQKQTRERQSD